MKNTSKTKSSRPLLRRPTLQLTIAVILFALTVVLSRGEHMHGWEIDVFTFFYGLPKALFVPFFVITQLGSVYLLLMLSIFYITRKHYHIVLRLLLGGTLAYLTSGVAKDLWGRLRPHEFLPDIVVLDYVVRGPGFPSGHTALATVLGLTLARYVTRPYQLVLYTLIVLVGLSRMYLGLHAPLDVLGGFALGWACYAIFCHVRIYDTVLGRRKAKAGVKKPQD